MDTMFRKRNLLAAMPALLLVVCGTQPAHADIADMTCPQHLQLAQKANDYASRNFTKTYANDLKGAEAQLFLIKEKGPGSFSVNLNAAERDYAANLSAATAAGCDTSEYPASPITEFSRRVDQLKASQG